MKRIFTLFLVLAAFVAAQAATYTVAGSGAVLNGESWKQDNAANDMTSADNENYTLTISGISVEAGSYEFKVVEDHDWTNCWPSSNYKFDITETAKYDIVYTFNATSKEITVTPTKVGAFEGSTGCNNRVAVYPFGSCFLTVSDKFIGREESILITVCTVMSGLGTEFTVFTASAAFTVNDGTKIDSVTVKMLSETIRAPSQFLQITV